MTIGRAPNTVYFIKPKGMDGPIKIGCSKSPECRLSALDTWSPFPLEIIAEYAGDKAIEGRFHALFQDTHERREWFAASPAIAAAVVAINAGTFDPSILPAKPVGISSRRYGQRRRWTEEQKFRVRYSNRLSRTLKTTGYDGPRHNWWTDFNDPSTRAPFDAYLEAPHVHGSPNCGEWAAARREEYHRVLITPMRPLKTPLLAWCPDELVDDYRILRRHMNAPEARAIIEHQMAQRRAA